MMIISKKLSDNNIQSIPLTGIWKLTDPDLRYAIENNLLKLSVRIVSRRMEIGGYEETPEGESFYIPHQHRWMDGLVDVCREDILTLFHDGVVSTRSFCLPDDTFASLIREDEVINLNRSDLLVRREERAQFEKNVLKLQPVVRGKCIDFRCFDFEEELFEFTEMQSRALNFMFECARKGNSEQYYREILDAASSASAKLGHLFSSRPKWTRIIKKAAGRRGWYYMEPMLVTALLT